MNCSEVSELIPLHLTGELDPPRSKKFAAHLDDCSACADNVRQHAALDAELRAGVLTERIDSDSFERRVMRSVRAASDAEHARQVWRFGLAAAAAFVLALAGMAGYRANFVTTPAPAVYAAAARDHRMEIVERQPRKWRVDAASIQELAGKQGIKVTDFAALAPAGYRLREGKLCRLDGQLFLHLVFTDGLQSVSLYLRRDLQADAAKRGRISTSDSGPDHVAGFEAGSLSAMCVTEQPGDAAVRFARAAAAAI